MGPIAMSPRQGPSLVILAPKIDLYFLSTSGHNYLAGLADQALEDLRLPAGHSFMAWALCTDTYTR